MSERIVEEVPRFGMPPGEERGVEADFAGGFRKIDVEQESRHWGITLRAVLVGFAIVILIAAAEPFNTFYHRNTALIGNHFPLAVVFAMLLLILVVNPLLKGLLPGSQFAPSELVVIFTLSYVCCCIPGTGLMRFWMTLLTGGFFYQVNHPEWVPMLERVPAWLFPSTDGNSEIVQNFWRGFGSGEITWEVWQRLISAWSVPMLTWGIFFLSVFTGSWCVVMLLRRQWVENEKLSFPLAQIALEIMRPPERGLLFNRLFRNKLLWITVGIVIFIHTLTALSSIFPYVPKISLKLDLTQQFSNFPWNHAPWKIVVYSVSFTVVGVTYFMTTRCSFSLWFFAYVTGLAVVVGAQIGRPISGYTWRFQFAGGMLVLLASMAWVARAHIKKILLAVIGRYKEPPGTEYMSYRVAAILFVVCFATATGWLTVAGVGFFFAAVMMIVLFMVLVTLARIVAETGAFFVQAPIGMITPTTFVTFPHQTLGISQDSYLIGHLVSTQMWDVSEAHMPYAINALRVADGVKRIGRRRWLMPI
ncbi:MAG: hypothetical protein QGD94_10195, partial [Planctomycetia bacterium]|nr:hypothetical protein [Planctomycetia bacterium]